MKKLIAALVLSLIATAAWAGSPAVVHANGAVDRSWPSRIDWPDGRVTIAPTAEQCVEAGVARWETPQEQAAREAIEAAQAAENQSNADAMATLPATFDHSIAVPDSNGHWQKLIAVTNGVPPVMLQVSGSPLTPEEARQMETAGKAAWQAKVNVAKAAKAKGNGLPALAERVAALEAMMGVK